MAISDWWRHDAREHFWLEITDRADLGANLIAPTTNLDGQSYWGYELLNFVEPTDVVYHWHKSLAGEPGIVGWSRAAGTAERDELAWRSRGTRGRESNSEVMRPAWRVDLLGYQPLPQPLTNSRLRAAEEEIRAVHGRLLNETPPKAKYFPFNFSPARPLRVLQTYLTKFPKELARTLDLPGTLLEGRGAGKPTGEPKRAISGARDAGVVADPVVRRAIELHAMRAAGDHYDSRGYAVTDTSASRPYDLEVAKGLEIRRVEVKGSSGSEIDTVELTAGEVGHNREFPLMDLFVVDSIEWTRVDDGSVVTSGGRSRLFEEWFTSDDSLEPTRFRFRLHRHLSAEIS